ncbi:MAG: DNA translocase FtsK [Candidatus Aminicenantales bacterium]
MKKKKNRKKISSLPKKRKKRRFSSNEAVAVILFFLAVFFFISLISYNANDPSWANVSSSVEKINNYAGRVGASLSEGLIQFTGLASYLIPLALFFLGTLSLFPEREKNYLLKIGSFLFLLFILSSLLSILSGTILWRGSEIAAGGFIGKLLSSFLISNFNHAGSLVILFSLSVLLLIISTGISLRNIFTFTARIFGFTVKEIRIKIIHYRRARRKEKERTKVIKKYMPQPEKKVELKKKEKEIEKKKALGLKKRLKKSRPQAVEKPVEVQPPLFKEIEKGGYTFPPLSLLDAGKETEKIDKEELFEKKQLIEDKLREFRVEGEVKEYHPGPIITTYEYYPDPGIKISQVASLSEDLGLALGAESVIVERMPGKPSLGIEIPNNRREIIRLRDILESEKFQKSPSILTLALGKTVHGEAYTSDLSIMPHLLIAGATGTGKSVALHCLIASILHKASPEEVKIILIDPKRLEFNMYDDIPHLMSPVIRDPKKAGSVLMDAINKMEERYHKIASLRARDIQQYNQRAFQIQNDRKSKLSPEEKKEFKPLPYIVIIIDELAELIMVGKQDVEQCIARLAQLARAVGIHLVMATQRPSIDVITGTIKNNFPSRIAFKVPTKVDSRIIIDGPGAEKLLGLGDMLFMPPNYPRLIRLHSAFISVPEITRLVKFVKVQGSPSYDEKIVRTIKRGGEGAIKEEGEKDELFEKAVELVLLTGQASASYLQRKLKLGYARAARIIDQMEQEGIVGPSEGSKPREILVDVKNYLRRMDEGQ